MFQVKNKKVSFISSGFVYGKYWGGGAGAYPAKKLQATTKKELLDKANDGLSGSLDSGMGFEKQLLGAILKIVTVTTVEINDKLFTNEESEIKFIGKLNKDQKAFLEGTLKQ